MIKKLLTTGLILSGLLAVRGQEMVKISGFEQDISGQRVKNQTTQNKSAQMPGIPDTDELFYFYNKHIFRNTPPVNSFPAIKSPVTGTNTINEFGSSFLNPGGATITVTGGFIFALRQANSTSTAIPCRMYLRSAGPTGVPGALIDSAMTAPVTSTAGLSFYAATFTNNPVVTGAYYLSFKPKPLNVADTIRVGLTSAYQPTSANAPANLKFGEGLSYTRYNGTLYSNTGFYGAQYSASDYENIVAAEVAFSYTANGTQMAPNGGTVNAAGYCANAPITFTNTSGNTSIIENRQYNYNVFATTWAPYANTPTWTPVADPVYNWSFSGPAPAGTYTTTNASHTYGAPGTNASANLIVKYQHGSADGTKTQDIKTFPTFTVVNCGLVGLSVNSINAGGLTIYPNPVVNGKANISGLEGASVVSVYNMLGQMVSTQTSDKETVTVDLSSQVQGTYLLRISDSNNKSKTIKIINQ